MKEDVMHYVILLLVVAVGVWAGLTLYKFVKL